MFYELSRTPGSGASLGLWMIKSGALFTLLGEGKEIWNLGHCKFTDSQEERGHS